MIKFHWSSGLADYFVLFCSGILTGASIVLVALVFWMQLKQPGTPPPIMDTLQRGISTLSITITSALMMVVGKHYVLFKIGRDGIRSRRVALYSNPSIGRLAFHLVCHGLEIPLLALSAVWALGLATGLIVNTLWGFAPVESWSTLQLPFGSLDVQDAHSARLLGFEQLSSVMEPVCSGVDGTSGVIGVKKVAQLSSGSLAVPLFYPPLPGYILNSIFSMSTPLNSFDITMESLPSIPPTAQALTCIDMTGSGNFTTTQLWYAEGDNQTMSIILNISVYYPSAGPPPFYRFNASAIVLGGLLESTSNAIEFTPNGTMWPNVMSSDQWARDIASLVCNATFPTLGSKTNCSKALSGGEQPLSLFAFWKVAQFFPDNQPPPQMVPDITKVLMTTMLGMAMGAYSLNIGPTSNVTIMDNNSPVFTAHHGIYILIANIVTSVTLIVVTLKLRRASGLGTDFINSTRLLMEPLRDPAVFNSSLDDIIDARQDPYMRVSDGKFVLAEEALPTRRAIENTGGGCQEKHPGGSE